LLLIRFGCSGVAGDQLSDSCRARHERRVIGRPLEHRIGLLRHLPLRSRRDGLIVGAHHIGDRNGLPGRLEISRPFLAAVDVEGPGGR